jgi:restriction endonuclease Mrr
LIDSAYQEITDELRSTLLNRITAASPAFFEKLVLDLLIAMGYGGSKADAGQTQLQHRVLETCSGSSPYAGVRGC